MYVHHVYDTHTHDSHFNIQDVSLNDRKNAINNHKISIEHFSKLKTESLVNKQTNKRTHEIHV